MGFISTVMDIGQTLGPIISGIILARSPSYMAMFVSLSALLVVAIVVFGYIKRKNENKALQKDQLYFNPTDPNKKSAEAWMSPQF